MPDKIIEMKNVNKWFGDFQVLKDINLDVNQKQKIVVCGPSGSGKSTLIRCINRLEEHQKGDIIVDGNQLTEDTKNIEKIRAEVGMVFQQFNLFPHLSILDNCTLAPIWVKKMPKRKSLLDEFNAAKDPMERLEIHRKIQGLPRNSAPTRVRNRCWATGKPRGVYRDFGLCRNQLRLRAHNGELPGVVKSSW